MLSPAEILELEKKVFHYRIKQRLHYVILALLIISLGVLGFYLYPMIMPSSESKEKKAVSHTLDSIQLSDNNASKTVETQHTTTTTNGAIETNTTLLPKYTPRLEKEEKNDETLRLSLPSITKNTSDKKNSYLPEPLERKSSFDVQEEELQSKILARKLPIKNEESFYRAPEDKIETALLPPPLLEEPKQKGIIKIETHEVNSIQYLKEKFDKTHNIVFALMLAEEYYLNKNYTESNKWALIANNIDADNEKSWVWFAKSKIKLGQKEDAVVALKAYLKSNKSKAVQSLLNQIILGEVLD